MSYRHAMALNSTRDGNVDVLDDIRVDVVAVPADWEF